ncbi:metal-dependent transcriptional regulator [Olivibacter sitiensis]|uniref:metal-dependent transcriptional regulator n=1 Tax=Olivibacter sitiensis TaxID=376470 RepID=UPI0003FE759D|nr:metal-dependent transcriptional regulator [Olivibacter sitiensis]
MLSITEENYLKALLHITTEKDGQQEAGTNLIAAQLQVRPATATDMLKKLKEKELVEYERYGKVTLTEKGRKLATEVVRKHRLWETFLYDKLGFSWDEVHEVAEQLEHVKSDKLIERLDKFLGYPSFDPHGDIIPKVNGQIVPSGRKSLSQAAVANTYKVKGVQDNSPTFLQYVAKLGIGINTSIKLLERFDFDGSVAIEVEGVRTSLSQKVADNIYII